MINSDPTINEIKTSDNEMPKFECFDFSYSNEILNDLKEDEKNASLNIQPVCPANVLTTKQQLILNVNNTSKINICNINQSAQCLKVSTIDSLNNKKVIQFKKVIKNTLNNVNTSITLPFENAEHKVILFFSYNL